MTKPVIYLDQNAWIALAQGSWDASSYPAERAALSLLGDARLAERIALPLTSTNIYETSKINDLVRRSHLAQVQAGLSDGWVLRGRQRLLHEQIRQHLARRCDRLATEVPEHWFLSNLWFESAADYDPTAFGTPISERALALMRANAGYALFTHLAGVDDDVGKESVRRYTKSSAALLEGIEARRAVAAGQSFALRKRADGVGPEAVVAETSSITRHTPAPQA